MKGRVAPRVVRKRAGLGLSRSRLTAMPSRIAPNWSFTVIITASRGRRGCSGPGAGDAPRDPTSDLIPPHSPRHSATSSARKV
jgi:hypothetical protein